MVVFNIFQKEDFDRERLYLSGRQDYPFCFPGNTPKVSRQLSYNDFDFEGGDLATPTRGGTRTPTTAEFFKFANMTPVHPASKNR